MVWASPLPRSGAAPLAIENTDEFLERSLGARPYGCAKCSDLPGSYRPNHFSAFWTGHKRLRWHFGGLIPTVKCEAAELKILDRSPWRVMLMLPCFNKTEGRAQ
jgi:hypothetical protein